MGAELRQYDDYPEMDAEDLDFIRELEAEEEAYVAAHQAELDLAMNKNKKKSDEEEEVFTRTDLDSVLWVTQHGLPTTWNPLVHDLEDEFFPQIGVLR